MIMGRRKGKKVVRDYNAGTWTSSMFWSFIRSSLRQKSRWWKPILIAKMNARRPYKGPNKRLKWEYQCNKCKKWYPDKKVNVDHIAPLGELRCYEDLPNFVKTLFCEASNLQVLCSGCHDKKTKQEKQKRKRKAELKQK